MKTFRHLDLFGQGLLIGEIECGGGVLRIWLVADFEALLYQNMMFFTQAF